MPLAQQSQELPELIGRARAAGVELWTEGPRLRFRGPAQGLPEDLREALRAQRAGIIAHLREEAGRRIDTGPLAANQRGLWFLHRLAKDSPAYNVAFAARVHGPLDLPAFQDALQVLVDRHESLRSFFPDTGGEPQRHTRGHVPLTVARVDARDWTREQLDRAVAQDYARPFDLETGPILRATLYDEADDRRVFLLVLHHIAVDGTGLFVLLEELFAIYPALREGQPVPALDTGATLAEFVAWQSGTLATADAERAYWTEVLTPPPARLELPTDRPRPAVPALRGGSTWCTLDAALTARLRAVAASHRATEYVFLLSVWFVLLHRLSGRTDLTVGTPVVGRPSARFARTVGDLINTLPLRVRDVSGMTVAELMQQVRTVVLEGMNRQDFPLPSMIAALGARPGAGAAPFQTLFMVQDFGRFNRFEELLHAPEDHRIPFGVLPLSHYDLVQQEGQFELSVDVWRRGEELLCAWKFDAELFDRATVDRFASCYVSLVQAAAAAPETLVSRLPLLGAAERRAVLEGPNATAAAPPAEPTVVHAFAAQARRQPAAVAVRHAGQGLTFAQLETRASQLARHLQGLGAGPGMLVGVCVERGLDMLVGVLGILQSGAAYVPLDPGFPAERLRYMLEDARAPLLVTQAPLAQALFPGGATRTVCLDTDAAAIARHDATPFAPPAAPGQAAYVLYTSGSTGRPKGVVIEHRALANFLASMARAPGLDASDVLLAVTTLSFDIAGLELFLPLTTGARIELVGRDVALDGVALAQALATAGATVMQATPATWRLLFESGWSGRPGLKVLVGGEALGRDLALRLLPVVAEVWNMYGPTETTIWSSLERITSADDICIGRPIANTQMYVLDAQHEPVPPGVVGELWIGGDGVAREYLHRPELTAERFRPNPFHPGRMYRTGDLARLRPDGRFDCLGRIDAQVKVRGYRIELGEIESVLGEHPAVAECAVVARELHGDTRLVAYFAGDAAVDALRAHLRARLPDYMIPGHFVALPALPQTPNRKIDRQALPVPDAAAAGPSSGTEYVEPATATERAVAAVFRDVLRVPRVGRRHHFFELGGHSLLATQAVTRLRAQVGGDVSLRALFEAPTVEGLAAWIDARAGPAPQPPVAPIPAVDRAGELPLAPVQERLWFLHQLEPTSAAYNLVVPLRLTGAVHLPAVRRACDALAARHEMLRSRFTAPAARPRLTITPPAAVPVEAMELAGTSEMELEQALLDWTNALARRPFPVDGGALFHVALARLASSDYVMVFSLHHIIADGWSLSILVRDWAELYAAAVQDRTPMLPTLPWGFVDVVAWQQQRRDAPDATGRGARDIDREYWTRQLNGCQPRSTFPSLRERPGQPTYHGQRWPLHFDAAFTRNVRAAAQAHQATPFMVLLASLCVVLQRHARQDDVIIGTPVAGRSRPENEAIVGPFLNLMPLRVQLQGAPTFSDVLRHVRDVTLDAFAHQDTPFEEIIQQAGLPRDMSTHPLFQVMLAYQNFPQPSLALPDLTLTPVPYDGGVAQFDWSVYLFEQADELVGTVEFSTDLYDQDAARALVARWQLLLQAAAAAPETLVSRLPLLGAAERRAVLEGPNATAAAPPAEPTVVHAFAAQARRQPAAVAVRHAGQGLTFAQLETRASQLARHLQGLGAGPGMLVGVCVERGLDMLVGVLGILQSGAAYVPLDPGFPAERLRYMLEDARAPLLVTQAPLAQALFPGGATRTVCLDTDAAAIARHDATPFAPPAAPGQAAYVLYTSGSTGRPKGVVIEHRALANFLASMARAPGLDASDVLLAVTTLSFDIAGLELFLPLTTGARIELVGRDVALDGVALAQALATAGATVMQATPATWRLLFESGWSGRPGLKVLVGGEALGRDLALRLLPVVAEVWNMYGPTETTIWSSLERITSADDICIGRPIANTQMYVLDAQHEPVPPGVVGELWIGGDGVAREYLHRPELTAERFRPNPFHPGRMYRTGDLARLRPDGRFDCLGRIDAQVKVRGYRIELGEIESVLGEHPAVAECAVVARELHGDTRLVAYFAGDAAVDALRAHLRARLPDYMIPGHFVALPALPQTPNRKIDRQALPVPDAAAAGPSSGTEYVEPATATERAVAAVFRDVLRVPQVGRRHHFFELGGHSLLATQVVTRLAQRLHQSIPLRALFDAPTVEALATWIDHQGGRAGPPAAGRSADTPPADTERFEF